MEKAKSVKVFCDDIRRTFPLPDTKIVDNNYRENTFCRLPHYWHCNDFPCRFESPSNYSGKSFYTFMDAVRSYTPAPERYIRVALLVGESCLTSILPELERSSDAVLMLDNDPCLLNVVVKSLEELQSTHSSLSEDLYLERISHSIVPIDSKQEFKDGYFHAKQHTKEFNPFFSEGRLSQVRSSARRISVIPVCVNAFSMDQMGTLKSLLSLHSVRINVINLTNLLEYHFPFFDDRINELAGVTLDEKKDLFEFHFNDLPLAQDAICGYSRVLQEPRFSKVTSSNDFWRDQIGYLKRLSCDDDWGVHNFFGSV
ncbi:hypothetical protein PAHA111176_22400 [Parendozoicomonas haliclonae]|uniref:Uncharacterized protein n=2 Tax=Parendozoicomonas haliclonae TaxID=1960125 RepID=A0A1X7ARB3_9GAMM|nr:hypothetical protein EHSB41UT_04592 [Parendozoicomonas haliclonae]